MVSSGEIWKVKYANTMFSFEVYPHGAFLDSLATRDARLHVSNGGGMQLLKPFCKVIIHTEAEDQFSVL